MFSAERKTVRYENLHLMPEVSESCRATTLLLELSMRCKLLVSIRKQGLEPGRQADPGSKSVEAEIGG